MSIFQVGWSLKMSTDKQVLAIKYRPQVFEELVGQNIIVEAIQKSISLDKIPNAFLFTGIRGVGKSYFFVFEQFKDFAKILAIVVLPTPLIPVNKKAFGILSNEIDFCIASTIIF